MILQVVSTNRIIIYFGLKNPDQLADPYNDCIPLIYRYLFNIVGFTLRAVYENSWFKKSLNLIIIIMNV